MLKLDYFKMRNWIYFYMALPVFCFLGLYIHSIIGVAFLTISLVAFFGVLRNTPKQKSSMSSVVIISRKVLTILAIVAVLWTYFGGQGYLYFQNGDWGCRNAIYRDLIYHKWPVIYETYDKALVYYVGYWLPMAALTKTIGKIFPVIMQTEVAFIIGNIFLWIWTSIGVFLVELLIFSYVKPKNKRNMSLVLTTLVLFSGLDILGVMSKIIFQNAFFDDLHLEWWTLGLQFSSLTTCLFWVFNQTITPWLAILCLIQEKNMRDFVFLGVCVFSSGPIPFMGIFVYMISYAVMRLVQSIRTVGMKEYIREIFSISNVCAVVVFVPFILYYMSNMAINTGINNSETTSSFLFFRFQPMSLEFLSEAGIFWILEVGVYYVLLFVSEKKNLYYWVSIIITLVAPFIRVGTASDFVMRSTIPTIMLIAVMCMKYLIENEALLEEKIRFFNKRFCYSCLIACLCIGAMTPLTEFMRGYCEILLNGKVNLVCEDVVTFNQDFNKDDMNFTTYGFGDTVFYKYMVGVNKR